ncbi:MAG: chorismate synthase [Melioribacteraceae bacterium]|nr:chorismate synthase [Melioribacteraceae bacterium]
MIRFLTAGESHGKALTVIVDGFPSNFELTTDYLNLHLKRRQIGYGRGLRMKIETDTAEILSGIRLGKTLGSPISMLIKNKDWGNWINIMSVDEVSSKTEKISIPRPGHADLTGVIKYGFDDIRNSIERSSARETAARVAAGSVARSFLEKFGIKIGSFVESIGGIYPGENFLNSLLENNITSKFDAWKLSQKADISSVRVLDKKHEVKIIGKIKTAKKNGNTLGGTMVTVATGVPAGLGSFVHYDRKLSTSIVQSIMSINAIKGVEIGSGFQSADSFGSESHDEIITKRGVLTRRTNRAGGIEGGISTGLPIIVRSAMKPIATLMSPIGTVDLSTGKNILARRERSDFVAVPACAVITESMLAWSLAEHFIRKFGGDSLEETLDNFTSYTKKIDSRIKKNFRN